MADEKFADDDPMQDETGADSGLDGETVEREQAGTVTLALPLKQDEWTEETIPLEGDRIELQRFGYKEYGIVVDKRPSNLGTHILWKYARN